MVEMISWFLKEKPGYLHEYQYRLGINHFFFKRHRCITNNYKAAAVYNTVAMWKQWEITQYITTYHNNYVAAAITH